MTRDALTVGQGPNDWTIGPITRTDFVRYQGASGDMNPIHHDEVFAKASGFPAPLGVGMFHAGVLNTFGTNWLGPANVRRTKVRFKSPVFPGDMLTFSGVVVRTYEENGERWVDIELNCVNQDGRSTVAGWMTFVVP